MPELRAQKMIIRSALVLATCMLYGCFADTMNQKESAAGLQTGLRSVAEVINADESARVLFYIENNSADSIKILPWQTPLEGELTADIFDITLNGDTLQYQGIMIKRAAPTDADYLTLSAGERREIVTSLSDSYDMSATGEYLVKLRTVADDTTFDINGVSAAISGDSVTIVRE
jgi:hypothetical protein